MAKRFKVARLAFRRPGETGPKRTVLAELLTERRTSLRELAAASGVSRAMIGHVSNLNNGIGLDKARAIAAALDTTVDHLFVDPPDPDDEP